MDRLDSRPQVSGMMTARKPYPSDVYDEEWALAVPYLTLLPETAGQRTHLLREAFNGLRYVVRHGIPWRAMPHDLPPWHAVYDQAMRWLRAGCFEMLAHDLRAVLRDPGLASSGAGDLALRDAVAAVWRVRDDRYSEERTDATSASRPRLEMFAMGG